MMGTVVLLGALWDIAASLLIHGLLLGTVVLALLLLGRYLLRTLPQRAAVWLWLPLLLLVFSPILPGFSVAMPDVTEIFTPQMSFLSAPDAASSDERPSVISEELINDTLVVVTTVEDPIVHVRYAPAWQSMVGLVWLAGALCVLGHQIYRHTVVRGRCRFAKETERRGRIRIFTLDGIRTPFVYGLFRPRIMLPTHPSAEGSAREMILLHEQTHVRRLDPLWRLLWEAALCVYWFQPLLWFARDAFIADTEGACDEAVLRSCGADKACRADYAQTLLLYAGPKQRTYPTAFGITELQGRVQAILHPAGIHTAGIVVLVLVILLVSAAALLSPGDGNAADALSQNDPVTSEIEEGVHNAVIRVEPTSALFGYVDGYVEARPEIWGATDVSFALPAGWSVEPQTAVNGYLLDTEGERCGTYAISVFSPIDSPDIPPENVPLPESRWKAIFLDLRLSSVQNVADADYRPIVTDQRSESAVAVMDQAIYEEGVPAAAWEHQRVPLVLSFDQDCSMSVMMTFDGTMEEAILEQIAASITFAKMN